MILIISKHDDIATTKVIDWLYYLNVPFCKLNGTDIFSLESKIFMELTGDKISIELVNNSSKYCLSLFNSIWFRRDQLYYLPEEFLNEINNKTYFSEIIDYLNTENSVSKQSFYSCLSFNKKILGHFTHNRVNKIQKATHFREWLR